MKKNKEYTIQELEDMANAWSWQNSANRKRYKVIIEFLGFIEPEILKGYNLEAKGRKNRKIILSNKNYESIRTIHRQKTKVVKRANSED